MFPLSKACRFIAAVVFFVALAPSASALSTPAEGAAGAVRIEVGPILTLAEEPTGHLAVGKGRGGDLLVAWSTPPGGDENQIRALRLAAAGRPMGPPFVVYSRLVDDNPVGLPDEIPDIGWNLKITPGVGYGFLVAWDDGLPGGLVARRVRGRENEIVEGYQIDSESFWPAAVSLAQGRFLLVYEQYSGSLLARRFDPEGLPLGDEIVLAAQGLAPAVVRDAAENILVASLTQDPHNASRFHLWARRFTADGSPLGKRRLLAGPLTTQIWGVRGASGTGGVSAFTWDHAGRVNLQLIAPDGSFRTVEVGQTPELPYHDVAVDAAGRALVVWADCCVAGERVHARLWAPDGTPLGPEILISPPLRDSPSVIGLPRLPAVAARDRGDFFVAWIGENGPDSPRPGEPAIFGVRVLAQDP